MSFDHAWVLAVAWIPLAWVALQWNIVERSTSFGRKAFVLRAGSILKALSIAAILIALGGPRLQVSLSKVAVALLVDTSASVSKADLERAWRFAAASGDARGSHWLRVIPFAAATRNLSQSESGNSWRFQTTSGEAARATDLEGGIRDAISTLPVDQIPRIVILTDGRETKGSIARAAWQARQLGIPIDTVVLGGRKQSGIHLESVQMQAEAFVGEPFPIELEVTADAAGPAEVELDAEGREIARAHAMLAKGSNRVLLHTSLNAPGALEISIVIRAGGAHDVTILSQDAKPDDKGGVRFDQSITMRRPRALYLTGDQPALDAHFLQALAAAQFETVRAIAIKDTKFSDYQLVILNNWELDKVSPEAQANVEAYVKNGGGLLVIGGARNLYSEGEKIGETLDRVLPAKLAPRAPDGRAVVIVLDRSTSMLGPKIDFARKAAAGVIDHLTPIDQVGVLVFDTSYLWQIPIRFADNRESINWMISRITANGGTRIAPALSEGYREILLSTAFYKHIILLTDGLSDEGNSYNLAREAGENAITISTVGLGRDVNRNYLQRIARLAGGQSYFIDDPAGLEQVVISDVKEHTGMSAVEAPIVPDVLHRAEILEGVDISHAPALQGYIRFEPKSASETILRVDQKNPLLTRWQYGLGRAAIFTSDAKTLWAANWVTWKGYDKFWINVCRDLLPHAHGAQTDLSYDTASGDLIATYRMDANASAPVPVPPIFAIGPNGFQGELPVKKIAEGAYRGSVHIGAREGLFRVRPLADSDMFPETGLYRPETELSVYGSNEALLRQVASFTGGRYQPTPGDVFAPDGRLVNVVWQLWPWLVALAMGLSVAELVLRKWRRS